MGNVSNILNEVIIILLDFIIRPLKRIGCAQIVKPHHTIEWLLNTNGAVYGHKGHIVKANLRAGLLVNVSVEGVLILKLYNVAVVAIPGDITKRNTGVLRPDGIIKLHPRVG